MDLPPLSTAIDVTGTLLIHSVWQGVLVGLLYALSMLVLAGSAPRIRYAVALFHLLLLALSPVVTALWLATSGSAVSLGPLAASLGVAGAGSLSAPALAPLVTAFWLSGVIVLGVRMVLTVRRTRHLTRSGCLPLTPFWDQRLQELATQMGVSRSVTIVESVLVSVPTVIGWLKPVILIPSSALLGLSQRQLELIVAHELAHIRRFDYVVNYFLLMMETVFFYHPVVYLIGRGLRHEREMCCDDLVVSRCGGRVEYVTALTDLETLRSGHALSEPLSNLAATGGDLLHRVQRIVRGRVPAARRMYLLVAVAAFTALVGATSLMAGQPADDEGGMVAVSQPAPVATPPAVTPMAFSTEPNDVPGLSRQIAPDVPPAAPRFVAAAQTPPPARAPVAAKPAALVASAAGGVEPSSASDPAPVVAEPVAAASRRVEAPAPVSDQPAVQAVMQGRSARAAVVERPKVRRAPLSAASGPTRAMMTELQLTRGALDSVSDLQRDASRALTVAKSPYVIVGASNVESDYVVSEAVREEGGALIRRIEPRYPSRARLRGYTDTVQIEFRVTGTGHVEDIVVVSASRASFERAVVRAVKKWRYEPLLRDGVPVERTLVETFAFVPGAAPSHNPGMGCRVDKADNTYSCTSPGVNRVM